MEATRAQAPEVLITGSTGYTGQLLVAAFLEQGGWDVAGTFCDSEPLGLPGCRDFRVDLASGEGLAACLNALPRLAVIVNCSAISVPAACERDPQRARALNVPTKLLAALADLEARTGRRPLLVQMSTDMVYDGSRPWWKEGDPTGPVHQYGASKLEAEQAIQAAWPHHAILRSSIIYGPQSPRPVERTLFLQFIDSVLAEQKPTTFFHDEWRTPVYVADVARVCIALAEQRDSLGQQRLFNMGGPTRLSRAEMARAVAEVRGRDPGCIEEVSAHSVPRPVASPQDISMVSDALEAQVGFALTGFKPALERIFAAKTA